MQVRAVDAVRVHQLKRLAVRWKNQNVPDLKIRGQAIKYTLQELELWEEEDEDTERVLEH